MKQKLLNKKSKDYLKVAVGVPLAYGSATFIGGKLPGVMGTTMSNALAPSVGMVGVVSKVGMLGWGYYTAKKFIPYKELKGGKKQNNGSSQSEE